MDQTPRLRSAFPETPHGNRKVRRLSKSSRSERLSTSGPLPAIPSAPAAKSSPRSEPVIPEHIIDAPSQRLYAFTLWVALWSWKVYDFYSLQESEEQSLWLFMKWVLLDGIVLFGLPEMKIPWLEWSSSTMTLLFCAHAFLDGMLMFRVSFNVGALVAAIGRSLWGVYETTISEKRINIDKVMFNESLILGRQVIHILPEGSAILNPEKESFCLDWSKPEARLPIRINATNPISMELVRVDLQSETNETMQISKRDIKNMHKEASRLISYSDKPNEPKTLYYSVTKPGLYYLEKVIDESNLEVSRKKRAHTVVVPCPKAAVKPTTHDRCKGELSNVEIEVTGTPPLKLKYRKVINQVTHDGTFESIQPEDFVSPLARPDHNAVVVPNKVHISWAKPQTIPVPLSESLHTGGKLVYSIEEVTDGFGNTVVYTDKDHTDHSRQKSKGPILHQIITVHERPQINMDRCSPQNPMKLAKGSSAQMPVKITMPGRGDNDAGTAYHIDYLFTPESGMSASGSQSVAAQPKRESVKNGNHGPTIQEPGLYTLTGVASDFCAGEVYEPASCLLQNPTEPQITMRQEEMFDKCAGSPIGLRLDFGLIGTPPFTVTYRSHRKGAQHHSIETTTIKGLRGQLDLTPNEAGEYTYDFLEISDAVYKGRRLEKMQLTQSVKPAASASFIHREKKNSCIDDKASFEVALGGEGPFNIEYDLVHGGKRTKYVVDQVTDNRLKIETPSLQDGGEYTLALVSVTDQMGCKEFLKDEAKISVRHQKPKVGFGHIEGSRIVDALEGKPIKLPIRLAGEAPWTVTYLENSGNQRVIKVHKPNDEIAIDGAGLYELVDVRDAHCPGSIDEGAKDFQVNWLGRPELRIPPSALLERKGEVLVKNEVCEGDDDAVEVLFKGAPPYLAHYIEHAKPLKGAVAPVNKDLRAALNVASLRMNTLHPGLYEYKFDKLGDANYPDNPKPSVISVQQRVNPKPSVAFDAPGKTYGYCSVESDGEEVIPITLHGTPPFELEVEIKHHGTMRPETLSLNNIMANSYNIRIPHSRVHLGKSAIILRRVSDSKGCSRILDSSVPRVQIAVHNAPTITALESQQDFCVGDRLNFALSGVAPFTVVYEFEGKQRRAQTSGTTFRRLAEQPGTFTIVGVQDSASKCQTNTNIPKRIHGMPSVRVSKGADKYVDIHEGGEVDISFDFGGVPPFEFTYTRSSNTEKGGKQGVVLDMRSETSEEHSKILRANQEGTYEVVAIKDRYCSYAKPGVNLNSMKMLQN
ncbi:Hypothetical protein R9X50_00015200 [Acrodontium crateriforme]|uniref:Nucleoporin Pom152 n=1 Tax=Acrodontium crateriforme TaxID=150365 RepID=A0AAQ3LX97_9PEZI|nr:Hypothetical protein R9X50_00015200 [Acrodontium crateriforme]